MIYLHQLLVYNLYLKPIIERADNFKWQMQDGGKKNGARAHNSHASREFSMKYGVCMSIISLSSGKTQDTLPSGNKGLGDLAQDR